MTDPEPHARWEHYHHGADIGVRGLGRTLEEAFAQTGLALTAVITPPQSVVARATVAIRCESEDLELLLVDWLNALVYEMATRRMLFGRFQVRLHGPVLEATAWGEPVDVVRHQPAVEVKGATYTTLRVARDTHGLWCAQAVVDV